MLALLLTIPNCPGQICCWWGDTVHSSLWFQKTHSSRVAWNQWGSRIFSYPSMKKENFSAQNLSTGTETVSSFSGVIGFWHCVLCCVLLFSKAVFFNFVLVEFLKFYVMRQQLVWLTLRESLVMSVRCQFVEYDAFQSWCETPIFCLINHIERIFFVAP